MLNDRTFVEVQGTGRTRDVFTYELNAMLKAGDEGMHRPQVFPPAIAGLRKK